MASNDQMVREAIELVRQDQHARKFIKGPSEVRDRFTSKYWRRWHTDKKILDELSLSKIREDLIRSSKTKPSNIDKDSLERNKMGSTFGREKKKEFFDYHLLGDTNVPYLAKEGLKKEMATISSTEFLRRYDSDMDSSNRGVLFGNASRFQKANLLTITCDYPQLETPISPNKGVTFGTSSRKKI
eukprot:gene24625-33093_t